MHAQLHPTENKRSKRRKGTTRLSETRRDQNVQDTTRQKRNRPSQANPSRAEPSRAKPSQVKPSHHRTSKTTLHPPDPRSPSSRQHPTTSHCLLTSAEVLLNETEIALFAGSRESGLDKENSTRNPLLSNACHGERCRGGVGLYSISCMVVVV